MGCAARCYAPAAALTAIVVPDLLLPWKAVPRAAVRLQTGGRHRHPGVPARPQRVLVIVVGMLVLWELRWLAG